MKSRIPYSKPSITNLEIEYTHDAVANGWGEKCYEYIYRFEEIFRNHLNVRHAIATSSCTGAIHMGMHALGIGPGDEIIIADTNWIATAAPIVHLGARPVFVDILPDSWCIDPEKAEAAITSKTKAIVAVHLYGNLCDMNRLLAIGEKYGIAIIEDAAEAIGSVYYNKRAGSMGVFGAFSFHGSKTLTTGEGGMFVTNNTALFERALTMSNHGRVSGDYKQFWSSLVGYKYKMSNVQAAIGCAQVERIGELTERKREILAFYKEHLKGAPDVSMNSEPIGTVNGAWMPTVVYSKKTGVSRAELLEEFKRQNIDARVFFWPLSKMRMFDSISSNHNAWDIPERAINLPSFHNMTNEEMHRVIDVVKSFIND